MTLVDTSVWIEVFRRARPLVLSTLVPFDDVVTCLPVILEVLQGFPDERALLAHLDQTENGLGSRYQALLDEREIDVAVLGLGRDGHVGFDEPGSGALSETRVVEALSRYTASVLSTTLSVIGA